MRERARVLTVLMVVELFAGVRVGADDAGRDGVALIERARELEDVQGAGAFEMQGTLAMKLEGKALFGNYKLRWWEKDRWQEEVTLAGFERKRDGVAQGYWQYRSTDYQPQIIFDMDRAMNVREMLRVDQGETVGKIRSRKVNGEELACVEVKEKSVVQKEMCFDPGGMLRRIQGEIGAGLQSPALTVEYGEAMSLGEKKFPSHIKIERPGRLTAEMTLGELKASPGQAPVAIGAGADGYQFWPSCNDRVVPTLASAITPGYPEEARRKRIQGMVALYAQVETSGKLSHIKTLRADDPSFEESVKRTVPQWRVTPSSCDGRPVVSETTIEVVFAIR